MNKNLPLVSIITPTYNQARFIEDTILSVKNQSYKNIEHIIIDGGSTDNTINILRKYKYSYNVLWISEPDEGQSDAINKGFNVAKGEIIGWLNSDDVYLSIYTISEIVKFFLNNFYAKIVYGDLILIDAENKVTLICPALPFFSYNLLTKIDFIPQPSTFFTREIIDNYHIDHCLHYAMDYDFWLKIGMKYKFYHINKILSCFRHHANSKSISQSKKMQNEDVIVKKKYSLALGKSNIIHLLMAKFIPLLPFLGIYKLFKLYSRTDFAFNIKLPPKAELIKSNLLLKKIFNKMITLPKLFLNLVKKIQE